MAHAYDLTNQSFGQFFVIRRSAYAGKKVKWECKCSCGTICFVNTSDLTSGKSTKCRRCGVKKHGATKGGSQPSITYRSWASMKARCLNPNATAYHRYGGRGITVHRAWIDSFEAFLSDVGERPSINHTLDRIDNSGNYAPGNVKWSTRKEQAQNREMTDRVRANISAPRNRNPLGQFIGH